jgi:hypothetical protein
MKALGRLPITLLITEFSADVSVATKEQVRKIFESWVSFLTALATDNQWRYAQEAQVVQLRLYECSDDIATFIINDCLDRNQVQGLEILCPTRQNPDKLTLLGILSAQAKSSEPYD